MSTNQQASAPVPPIAPKAVHTTPTTPAIDSPEYEKMILAVMGMTPQESKPLPKRPNPERKF